MSRDADIRVSADSHLGMGSPPFPMVPGPPQDSSWDSVPTGWGPHGSLNERGISMVERTGCSSVDPGLIPSTHAAIPGDPAPSPGLLQYPAQMWSTERRAAETPMHMK